jgi:hypothetical protein
LNGARARVIRIRVRVHVRAMHWGRSGVGVEIYIEQGLDGVRASSASVRLELDKSSEDQS